MPGFTPRNRGAAQSKKVFCPPVFTSSTISVRLSLCGDVAQSVQKILLRLPGRRSSKWLEDNGGRFLP